MNNQHNSLATLRAALAAAMVAACLLGTGAATFAAPPKGDGGQSKGTAQLKGGDGVFGVVYTMQSGYNLQLLKAKYTLEGHSDSAATQPKADEKLWVLTFAVKNPKTSEEVYFHHLDITLVDEDDNNYTTPCCSTKIAKTGSKEVALTLKPGQGIGQDPTINELSMAIEVPAKARIKKMLLNDGRANVPGEKVLRFNVAGFPGGSPKNVIAPLPKYAADPTDPTGAVALLVSPAVIGKAYPCGAFLLRIESVTTSATATNGERVPEDGKQWVTLVVNAKNTFGKDGEPTSTYTIPNDLVLRDTNGEKYAVVSGWNKRGAAKDAETVVDVSPGEETTFHWIFEVPKDIKLKSVNFGGDTGGCHVYQLDLTEVK